MPLVPYRWNCALMCARRSCTLKRVCIEHDIYNSSRTGSQSLQVSARICEIITFRRGPAGAGLARLRKPVNDSFFVRFQENNARV